MPAPSAARKITIYAGPEVAAATEGFESRSGRITSICGRYAALVKDATPALLEGEWLALCDALNGTLLHDDASIRLIWAEIADAEGLGDKWGIDAASLSERLRALPFAAKVAVADVAERFWRLPKDERKSYADALRAAGANILSASTSRGPTPSPMLRSRTRKRSRPT